MVQIDIQYHGNLRCEAVHDPSGDRLKTDAPVDNHGRGEAFSPTDLLATSLGACMLTLMGIQANKESVDLGEVNVRVLKEMTSEGPRRVRKLTVEFRVPNSFPADVTARLEEAALGCPVRRSLSSEVEVDATIEWGTAG